MNKSIFTLLVAFVFIFSANAQQITNVSPNNGTAGQNLTIVVTGQGTNFNQGTSTNQMSLIHSQNSSTINAYSINGTTNSSATANFAIPSNASLGLYDLFAFNVIDGPMSMIGAVTINPGPSIQSVVPDSAIFGQTLGVVITTANTSFSQGTQVSVYLSQGTNTILNATSAAAVNGTTINAQFTIPAPYTLGYYTVHLNNLALPNSFYINGGSSLLGGTIVQGTKAAEGDPIADLDLFLMSKNNDTLLSTTTNSNGEFKFEYLAFGTYKLFGDKLNNSHPLVYVLDAANPEIDSLVIRLNGDSLVSGLQPVDNASNIKVFPNPFSSNLIVELGDNGSNYFEARIYDYSGRLVKRLNIGQASHLGSTISIQTDDLNNHSIYYLNLVSRDGSSKNFKILKSE